MLSWCGLLINFLAFYVLAHLGPSKHSSGPSLNVSLFNVSLIKKKKSRAYILLRFVGLRSSGEWLFAGETGIWAYVSVSVSTYAI